MIAFFRTGNLYNDTSTTVPLVRLAQGKAQNAKSTRESRRASLGSGDHIDIHVGSDARVSRILNQTDRGRIACLYCTPSARTPAAARGAAAARAVTPNPWRHGPSP